MGSEMIVTIAGAKGGVGKTTTSINLGAGIAATGCSVVVVELDLAMANVVDFLSFPREESDPTLHDVLAGNAATEDAVYQVSSNFAVAPSGTDLEGYSSVDFDRLSVVLDDLRDAFDVIIVDTGAGLSRATIEPIRLADATVLVSTPRVAAIRDVEKTKSLSERVDTAVYGLVLTKSGTGASPGPKRIADFLDVHLLGHIPEDEAVPSSQDSGEPVIESAPDSDAATQYRHVAGNLLLRLETDQSVTADRSDSPQTSRSSSGSGLQEPPVRSVSEWMDDTRDSDGAPAEPSQTETDRTAMSDGQGRSRYDDAPSTTQTESSGAADDGSVAPREANHPETTSEPTRAITHVPEAADAAETSETDRGMETNAAREAPADSEHNSEEQATGTEELASTPETRDADADANSAVRPNSDSEEEGDSSGSSLTARLRSFVNRL